MINNNLCETCDKGTVCKNKDILSKFDQYAKKPLGVELTIEACKNYAFEEDDLEEEEYDIDDGENE